MKLRELWSDQAGVTSAETALILVLVSLVALVTWQSLGDAVDNTVTDSGAHLNETR